MDFVRGAIHIHPIMTQNIYDVQIHKAMACASLGRGLADVEWPAIRRSTSRCADRESSISAAAAAGSAASRASISFAGAQAGRIRNACWPRLRP